MKSQNTIPYGESLQFLIDRIFEALKTCCELHDRRTAINEDNKFIADCYNLKDKAFPYQKSGLNNHINTERLTRLTIQAFNSAQKLSENSKNKGARYLPSPLNILLSILTVPEEPYTKAFALAACRSYLYHDIDCYPEGYLKPDKSKAFTVQSIETEYESLKKYKAIRDNIPSNSKPEHIVLTNFLAMKGIYCLRFGSTGKSERSTMNLQEAREARIAYCENKIIYNTDSITKGINPEFRLSSRHDDIASYSEVFNQLWGIPVSIRGFSTLFHGGMRTAENGGLVISVSGSPGTGKTSFALAYANTLSGMGASCYYMSIEEDPSDLRTKLTSLIPAYFRKLSLYRQNIHSWFYPQKICISDFDLQSFTNTHIKEISNMISTSRKTGNTNSIPALCPLVVVIDSLTGFLNNDRNGNDYKQLEAFISACRELNVIVILLASDEISIYRNIEYLVDTVITLHHKDTERLSTKPRRIFELLKTRKQSSRPGSHIFHIEGDKGFRISPQLPSQLDKKQNLSKVLPTDENVIHAFNIWDEKGTDYEANTPQYQYLTINASSQILLHGMGSSGKASLGLKILSMPVITDHKRPKTPQRILIISFLYPREYYHKLAISLKALRRKIYPKQPEAEIECMSFYPGYLTPEDFVGKITRAIEVAELLGKPFSGILIDGAHNVYLQFPSLQESDMVWPMLYNVLSRGDLTSVTTFTTFAINDYKNTGQDKSALSLERQAPFLHALVQASDYLIRVEKDITKRNRIYIENSISQFKHHDLEVYWDDNKYVITADTKVRESVSTKKSTKNKDLFSDD